MLIMCKIFGSQQVYFTVYMCVGGTSNMASVSEEEMGISSSSATGPS